MNINRESHPIGSRLLVAWMIRGEDATLRSAWNGIQERVPCWIENDQITEIRVEEYSPSGQRVRVSSPRDDCMHSPSAGWYPVQRIIVKEALP